jgi:outer membrane protein OmpA-like peptidoglycan-associated protein
MKTKFLKIAAVFGLAGLLLFSSFPANARKYSRSYKKKYFAAKKMSSTALAKMKIKNVEFAFNKAEVPVRAHANLDRIAQLMKDNNASVKLGGYADNKGGYVYNWKLSQARAESVKAYLASDGADSTRIAATEYGYTHPIASNKTPAGRKKNRRVEIHFVE